MINLEQTFTPRVNPADTDYPFGSLKDNTSPGANDGTLLSAVWGNDFEGFRQAAMTEAGIIPSGLPDTAQDSQLLEAVKAVASNELRSELSSDAGANLVEFKPSGIASAIKRGVGDVIYDQIIDVKWFGAIGDWNMGTQTGADDTAALQAAINHYATVGSRRTGGRRAIKIPVGHYRFSALTIPSSINFGLDFVGDGPNATYLWADHNNTSPAFDCQAEFIHFRDIAFIGSLSDQNKGDSGLWKDLGFKCKLGWNYADIDIKFTNCAALCWKTFAEVHGRGFVFDGGTVGRVNYFMNIVADEDTVWVAGSAINSAQTGMRHYTIRNTRFDVVSRVFLITGTAVQKDYIHDILCIGNDFTVVDVLIEGVDATIRKVNISCNNALASFATGVIKVKSLINGLIVSNILCKKYDDFSYPSTGADCIESVVITSAAVVGLTISNNIIKNLKGNVVTAGSSSIDVRITNNYFNNAWHVYTQENHYVFYSTVNCEGLVINNNSFYASSVSGTYHLWNETVQTSNNTVYGKNTASWSWADPRPRYTPKLLVNGVQSAATPLGVHGRFYSDDTYVYVDAMIVIDPTETTGNLSVSLPVPAIAESFTITGSYSGAGSVNKASGFASTGSVFAPIQINPSTQEAELWKVSGLSSSRVTAADTSGTVLLAVSFKYRY